jgi:hypothetical protein
MARANFSAKGPKFSGFNFLGENKIPSKIKIYIDFWGEDCFIFGKKILAWLGASSIIARQKIFRADFLPHDFLKKNFHAGELGGSRYPSDRKSVV